MKKTFARQLLLTLSLLLATILLLSASIQLLFYRFTRQSIRDDLSGTADAMAEMCSVLYGESGSDLLLRMELSYTARTTGDDLLLLDANGTVYACSDGQQQCAHLGYSFDPIGRMRDNRAFADAGATALYGEQRMAAVSPVYDAEGALAACVVASCGYGDIYRIMGNTLRINLVTVLLVLPVAALAVYLVVRRQTRPMKQMADAARRLGRGQTDVQVPTGGGNTAELDELAVAFNNMTKALSASERKRQEFVANVSHELKTPMTTISGYMDGMLDGTIPPEQHPKYMRLISGEVKRLSRLVRSMLEVSRLQDKGIPPEKMRPFDVCETLGLGLITFEQKIEGKALDVQVDFPELGAMVLGDPDAITQVIYNLIDNAVKFCPEQGRLSLSVRPAQGGKYLISIANTGQSIPPEELPLVFDRFHKTDKSRSMDRDGVGLGLYIVKTIICSHEEDIFVSSRDGVTEFSFTLRRARTDLRGDAEDALDVAGPHEEL